MNVKFGAGEQTIPVESETFVGGAPGETRTVVNDPVAVPQSQSGGLTKFALGDKIPSFDEVILPRVNIAQNIGELKNSFEPGTLVLNQAVVLFVPPVINAKTQVVERQATAPATITVLGFKPTRFVEKIEGSGERGPIVNTEEDVRKAGGTLDYNEYQLKKSSGMRRFEQLADALVAIEKPADVADDDTMFVYPVNGVKYALALWAMKGVNYTNVAKRVFFTARAIGCLRTGYPTHSFSVSTREETYKGGKKAWIGVCIPKARSTPEFLAFVADVLDQKQPS